MRPLVWILLLACTFSALAQQPEEERRKQWLERVMKAQTAAPAPPVRDGSGVTAEDVEMQSSTLGRVMHYRVLLPAGYTQSHRHYPVLYMLHGFLNPYYEWDRQTELARHMAPYDVIVVLVQGDNAFYLDSAVPGSRDQYQTYFNRELMPHVAARYRIITETHGRAIAGVSMGGYGAMLSILKRPGAWVFAATFAGAVNFAQDTELQKNLAPVFDVRALGNRDTVDVMKLLAAADVALLPYVYIVCGADDHLLPENLAFQKALQEKKVRHELHIVPGGHEWIVWDEQLPQMFARMAQLIPSMRKR
ncbi:MAG TPA: alpha/beta hydrolase-fold protein [Thermoanaerobaculia bacterium]|nr:alpha/beta hydrolase-fold protein [Thermoanaerobaculia bacterium]